MAEEFLGRGIVTPFRRAGSADFENADGFELVKSAVREVLGTIGDSSLASGELPWKTEFGGSLHILRHRNLLEDLAAEARILVERALLTHEPRVEVTDVEVDPVPEETTLKIRVFIRLITEDVPANNVLLQPAAQAVEVTI